MVDWQESIGQDFFATRVTFESHLFLIKIRFSPKLTMENSSENSKATTDEVAHLKAQLAQLQHKAALGELLGTTAHEFNNILMTVINYAKLGIRQKDDAARERAFTKIMEAGQKAAKITESVLGSAKNRGNSIEPTDLQTIVEQSLMLLEREMRKYRVSVETSFDPCPQAMINGNQIQQVLLNLMINARQAMKEGGTILVSISHDSENSTVDLQVRDTGSGIPQDQLPRIFDAYFSTKDGPDETGRGGAGLGLAACKEIVDQHRGRIRVQSTVGRGTAFVIKLPVAVSKAA